MPSHKSTRRPGASLLRDVSHPFPGPGTAAVILVGAVQGESCAAAGIQHGGRESQRRRQVTTPPRRRTNNSTIGQGAVTVRSSAGAARLQTAVLQICKILKKIVIYVGRTQIFYLPLLEDEFIPYEFRVLRGGRPQVSTQ